MFCNFDKFSCIRSGVRLFTIDGKLLPSQFISTSATSVSSGVFLLSGSNGSGKTSLLLNMAGYFTASDGRDKKAQGGGGKLKGSTIEDDAADGSLYYSSLSGFSLTSSASTGAASLLSPSQLASLKLIEWHGDEPWLNYDLSLADNFLLFSLLQENSELDFKSSSADIPDMLIALASVLHWPDKLTNMHSRLFYGSSGDGLTSTYFASLLHYLLAFNLLDPYFCSIDEQKAASATNEEVFGSKDLIETSGKSWGGENWNGKSWNDEYIAKLQQRLTSLLFKPVAKFSYGQIHKISLIRVLLSSRPAIILDEPFSGLDAASCDFLLLKLWQKSKTGSLVVISSPVALRDRLITFRTSASRNFDASDNLEQRTTASSLANASIDANSNRLHNFKWQPVPGLVINQSKAGAMGDYQASNPYIYGNSASSNSASSNSASSNSASGSKLQFYSLDAVEAPVDGLDAGSGLEGILNEGQDVKKHERLSSRIQDNSKFQRGQIYQNSNGYSKTLSSDISVSKANGSDNVEGLSGGRLAKRSLTKLGILRLLMPLLPRSSSLLSVILTLAALSIFVLFVIDSLTSRVATFSSSSIISVIVPCLVMLTAMLVLIFQARPLLSESRDLRLWHGLDYHSDMLESVWFYRFASTVRHCFIAFLFSLLIISFSLTSGYSALTLVFLLLVILFFSPSVASSLLLLNSLLLLSYRSSYHAFAVVLSALFILLFLPDFVLIIVMLDQLVEALPALVNYDMSVRGSVGEWGWYQSLVFLLEFFFTAAGDFIFGTLSGSSNIADLPYNISLHHLFSTFIFFVTLQLLKLLIFAPLSFKIFALTLRQYFDD